MAKDEKKKPANLTTFMLSQDYLPEHWDWTPAEKNILISASNTADSAKLVGAVIFDRLIAAGFDIEEAYAITHDKDEHVIWSEYKSQYITSFTSHHIHFVAKLKKGAPLEQISDAIGVAPNYIEKPRAGRYSYDNMLSYMIHIKYPQKYRYDARSVVTFAGKDYFNGYYSECHKQWMHGRAERIELETRMTLKDVEMMIMDGQLSQKDLVLKPEYRYVYQKHRAHLLDLIAVHIQYLKDQDNAIAGRLDENDILAKRGSSISGDPASNEEE